MFKKGYFSKVLLLDNCGELIEGVFYKEVSDLHYPKIQ